MKITLDGVVVEEQPTAISWSAPRQLGYDGEGRPIFASYRSCSLAFERMTDTQYHQWFAASRDGNLHTVELPHPQSGILTEFECFVHEFGGRMNARGKCIGYASGVDILLTRIEVV